MVDARLPIRYYACLMRVWREDDAAPWRVLIKHISTEEQLLFPDLQAAFAYIESQLAEAAAQGPSLPAP